MIASREKLGDLCSLVTKGTTPTSVGFDFAERGVPFLRIQNISGNTVSLNDVLYIDEGTHNALARSKIRAGDFLITIAGTIGRTAIVPQDFPESNCNQAVAILRFDESKLWPKFLLYWLSTEGATSQISGRKVTATISNLSLGQIKELEIPLPPLPEQKRIAAILDKADTIRRKRQQAIQLADDFLRAVFLNMFELSALETVNLGSLCNVKGGKRLPQGHDYSELPTKHPYIRVVDFQGGTVRRSKLKYIDEATHSKISNYTIASNDVYISIAGTVGVSGVVPEDLSGANLTENAAKLILKDSSVLEAEYLAYWLSTSEAQAQIRSKTMLTSQPKLALFRIEELLLPLPNIHEQRKFLLVKKKIHSLLESMKHDWEAAGSLFEAASQKAFSGQL